jgi:hypothetical protein
MTERKPPGKSWEDKPYDPDWWAKQLVRHENISLLPPTRLAPLDVEALVADWRRRSTANRKDG